MPRVPMNLLFDDIEVIESVGDPSAVEVSGISHDSRRVVPGDLFCCVPGRCQRWARPRRRGGGPWRHRPPVRALHSRADRPGRGADPDRAGHHAPGHGPAGRRLLRLPRPRSVDDRRDGNQRQDDGDAVAGRPPRARPAVRRMSWGRCRGRGRRPRPPRCSGCWPACATARSPTAIVMRSPWRCRATRWSKHGSRASISTSRSSPTSATTTSTTTGRWRSTSRRRRCSSPRATRCAASSTRTIPGVNVSWSTPASPPSPCITVTPPTLCCVPATRSSPGAGSGSSPR